MILKDNNSILTPKMLDFKSFSMLCQYALTQCERKAFNMMHSTFGLVTVNMLNVYHDGNEHHYKDVLQALFPGKPYGHDYDCWKSLVFKKLIKFSSKHSYGSKYYEITPLGREVLEIANANQAYFRIMRWFKIKGEDIYAAMMKADLNGEESWKDLLPETMLELFKQLFDPDSKMRQLGSAYRWMNNVINLLKNDNDFYEKATVPEVMDWIESHRSSNIEVQNFFNVLAKIQKRKAKKMKKLNSL